MTDRSRSRFGALGRAVIAVGRFLTCGLIFGRGNSSAASRSMMRDRTALSILLLHGTSHALKETRRMTQVPKLDFDRAHDVAMRLYEATDLLAEAPLDKIAGLAMVMGIEIAKVFPDFETQRKMTEAALAVTREGIAATNRIKMKHPMEGAA